MKPIYLPMMLTLAGCSATELDFAPASLSVGYPVYVSEGDQNCRFGIQDVIGLRHEDLTDWMRDLPTKSRQIDLVSKGEPGRCIRRAYSIVQRAGFNSILVRHSGDVSYPSGLPPA